MSSHFWTSARVCALFSALSYGFIVVLFANAATPLPAGGTIRTYSVSTDPGPNGTFVPRIRAGNYEIVVQLVDGRTERILLPQQNPSSLLYVQEALTLPSNEEEHLIVLEELQSLLDGVGEIEPRPSASPVGSPSATPTVSPAPSPSESPGYPSTFWPTHAPTATPQPTFIPNPTWPHSAPSFPFWPATPAPSATPVVIPTTTFPPRPAPVSPLPTVSPVQSPVGSSTVPPTHTPAVPLPSASPSTAPTPVLRDTPEPFPTAPPTPFPTTSPDPDPTASATQTPPSPSPTETPQCPDDQPCRCEADQYCAQSIVEENGCRYAVSECHNCPQSECGVNNQCPAGTQCRAVAPADPMCPGIAKCVPCDPPKTSGCPTDVQCNEDLQFCATSPSDQGACPREIVGVCQCKPPPPENISGCTTNADCDAGLSCKITTTKDAATGCTTKRSGKCECPEPSEEGTCTADFQCSSLKEGLTCHLDGRQQCATGRCACEKETVEVWNERACPAGTEREAYSIIDDSACPSIQFHNYRCRPLESPVPEPTATAPESTPEETPTVAPTPEPEDTEDDTEEEEEPEDDETPTPTPVESPSPSPSASPSPSPIATPEVKWPKVNPVIGFTADPDGADGDPLTGEGGDNSSLTPDLTTETGERVPSASTPVLPTPTKEEALQSLATYEEMRTFEQLFDMRIPASAAGSAYIYGLGEGTDACARVGNASMPVGYGYRSHVPTSQEFQVYGNFFATALSTMTLPPGMPRCVWTSTPAGKDLMLAFCVNPAGGWTLEPYAAPWTALFPRLSLMEFLNRNKLPVICIAPLKAETNFGPDYFLGILRTVARPFTEVNLSPEERAATERFYAQLQVMSAAREKARLPGVIPPELEYLVVPQLGIPLKSYLGMYFARYHNFDRLLTLFPPLSERTVSNSDAFVRRHCEFYRGLVSRENETVSEQDLLALYFTSYLDQHCVSDWMPESLAVSTIQKLSGGFSLPDNMIRRGFLRRVLIDKCAALSRSPASLDRWVVSPFCYAIPYLHYTPIASSLLSWAEAIDECTKGPTCGAEARLLFAQAALSSALEWTAAKHVATFLSASRFTALRAVAKATRAPSPVAWMEVKQAVLAMERAAETVPVSLRTAAAKCAAPETGVSALRSEAEDVVRYTLAHELGTSQPMSAGKAAIKLRQKGWLAQEWIDPDDTSVRLLRIISPPILEDGRPSIWAKLNKQLSVLESGAEGELGDSARRPIIVLFDTEGKYLGRSNGRNVGYRGYDVITLLPRSAWAADGQFSGGLVGTAFHELGHSRIWSMAAQGRLTLWSDAFNGPLSLNALEYGYGTSIYSSEFYVRKMNLGWARQLQKLVLDENPQLAQLSAKELREKAPAVFQNIFEEPANIVRQQAQIAADLVEANDAILRGPKLFYYNPIYPSMAEYAEYATMPGAGNIHYVVVTPKPGAPVTWTSRIIAVDYESNFGAAALDPNSNVFRAAFFNTMQRRLALQSEELQRYLAVVRRQFHETDGKFITAKLRGVPEELMDRPASELATLLDDFFKSLQQNTRHRATVDRSVMKYVDRNLPPGR